MTRLKGFKKLPLLSLHEHFHVPLQTSCEPKWAWEILSFYLPRLPSVHLLKAASVAIIRVHAGDTMPEFFTQVQCNVLNFVPQKRCVEVLAPYPTPRAVPQNMTFTGNRIFTKVMKCKDNSSNMTNVLIRMDDLDAETDTQRAERRGHITMCLE